MAFRAAAVSFIVGGVSMTLAITWIAATFARGWASFDAAERRTGDLSVALRNIPGQFQKSAMPVAGYAVGSCVDLKGSRAETTVVGADCDGITTAGAYKVIAIGRSPSSCPSDADQVNFQKRDVEGFALCLDYNWVPHSCLLLDSGWKADRVLCDLRTDTGTVVVPTDVIVGVDNSGGCLKGGIVHAQRRFTVCVHRADR